MKHKITRKKMFKSTYYSEKKSVKNNTKKKLYTNNPYEYAQNPQQILVN